MRIQLDLDEKGVKLLDRLKITTGSRTHKELFNNAITLLDWAISQRQSGRIVASLDESNQNYKELQMPALEYSASPTLHKASSKKIARFDEELA